MTIRTVSVRLIVAMMGACAAIGNAAGADRAGQPTFACQGRLNATEYKVCTTPALAAADQRLGGLYEDVKRRIRPRSDVEYLVADQKRWLAERDACWTKRCIGRAYAQRIDTLATYAVLRDD